MVPLYPDVLDNELKLGESLCAPAQWFESRDLTCDGLQVRVALETETSDGLDIATLAFETGLSMEWVTDLCSTPLFYHR